MVMNLCCNQVFHELLHVLLCVFCSVLESISVCLHACLCCLVCVLEQQELQWNTSFPVASVCKLVCATLFLKIHFIVIISVCLYCCSFVFLGFVYWSNRNCNGLHHVHGQVYAKSYVFVYQRSDHCSHKC